MPTRTSLVLLAAMVTCSPLAPRRPVPAQPVYVNRDLLAFFGWLQQSAATETVLCLLGVFEDGTIRVDGVAAPHVFRRGPMEVQYAGCRMPGAVGTWHLHPKATPDCEFSEPDRESFDHSRLFIDLLSCGTRELRYRMSGDTTTYTPET